MISTLGCRDEVEAPTAPAAPELATASGAALSFVQVSAGGDHTCGVATDGRAYCWGANYSGQLGTGTSEGHSRPAPVAGGLRFDHVAAGFEHTCGITTDDRAYCWGSDGFGQVGDGGTLVDNRRTPFPVAGGRRYRQIRAGTFHTCAVNTIDLAFCWGSNEWGQLGTGGGSATSPVRVAGGLRFRRVITGGLHTCGATTDDRGYCWGDNTFGQLGDGNHIKQNKPVAVAGGLRFRQVLAGGSLASDGQGREPNNGHSCGITTTGQVYCWGDNSSGQLGDGTTARRSTPTPIAGGRRYRELSPGNNHTCAVTLTDVAFCWGNNQEGQIGDKTQNTFRPAPVRVAGGLRFTGVSTGVVGRHSCGVSTDGRAYCWGDNSTGQIGDGTRSTDRLKPVAVVAP